MAGNFPIVAPASGAYPLTTGFSNVAQQAASDANNTNDVDNYAWAGVDAAPIGVRCATTGSETFTIVSGSVTQINGTTVDGVSVAVNDTVLIKDAPASSGAGSVGSLNPGNGVYYVTAVATNITVARAATMSTTSANLNPAGRIAFVRAGTTNGLTMWQVDSPVADATFTYGTTAMQWQNYLLAVNSSIVPAATGFNLGTATKYWNELFVNEVQFEGASPTIAGNPNFSGSPTFVGGNGIPNAAIQQAGINNFNTSLQSQATVAGTSYYIAGSALKMPTTPLVGMQANKTCFIWNIALTKNANGTGTFQIVIFRGTNGTTADTADVTQTIGTQTAVIDEIILNIMLVVTTTGATGGYYWTILPDNRASVPATPAGFGVPGTGSNAYLNGSVSSVAMNTAGITFGIGFIANTGGTMPTITVPSVQSFGYNVN